MSRPAGLPKTGGRAKGTPNRKTMDLESLLKRRDFDPIEELLKTFPDLEPHNKAAILIQLMHFLYPKRKAIDMVSTSEQTTMVQIVLPSNGREHDS